MKIEGKDKDILEAGKTLYNLLGEKGTRVSSVRSAVIAALSPEFKDQFKEDMSKLSNKIRAEANLIEERSVLESTLAFNALADEYPDYSNDLLVVASKNTKQSMYNQALSASRKLLSGTGYGPHSVRAKVDYWVFEYFNEE